MANTKKIVTVAEDIEKLDPSNTAGGNVQRCCKHLGRVVVAQKLKHKIIIGPNSSILGYTQ
jgi:hypothetical protein